MQLERAVLQALQLQGRLGALQPLHRRLDAAVVAVRLGVVVQRCMAGRGEREGKAGFHAGNA